MPDYEEFSQGLGRMSQNRSSLIDSNENNLGNVCHTPDTHPGSRGPEASHQSHNDSSLPHVPDTPRQQRNFEIYEDTPPPIPRGTNLRARHIDPAITDSSLVSPARESAHLRQVSVSYQPHIDSQHPYVPDTPRQQRNFEIYEDSPTPNPRGTNIRARYTDPTITDSSLGTSARESAHLRQVSVSYQPHIDSQHLYVPDTPRQQRNFEIYEDSPPHNPRGTNLRARYTDPAITDSSLVSPARESAHLRQVSVSYQPHIDSQHLYVPDTPRQQRNFEIYEDSPSSNPRGTNLRERYIDPAITDSNLVRVSARLSGNCNRRSARQYEDPAPLMEACLRGGRTTIEFQNDPHHASRCPLNLSNLGGHRVPSVVNQPDAHHAFGQPSELSDIGGYTRRAPSVQDRQDSFQISRPAFNLSGIGGRRQEGASDSYHLPGRALNLSNFGAQVPSGSHNASGRPWNLEDMGPRTPACQAASDSINTSGRPCNLQSFTDRTPDIRIQSPSCDGSGRTLNMSELNRSQTPRPENFCNVSAQGGGQYLQVPCAQFGKSEVESRSQCPILSDAHSSCQSPAVNFRDQPQSTLLQSNVCPPPESQQYPCRMPLVGEGGTCPQQNIFSSGSGTCPQECPNLSQEQLVQFLQNGDLNQICDPASGTTRSPLFDTLVKDKYYPGAIEDTVNGNFDFNRVAFDAVFDSDNIPNKIEEENVPMTLLEAFELRIQYEKDLLEAFKGRKESCLNEQRHELDVKLKKGTKPEDEHVDQTPFWIHRDELKLACTIDIDLSSNIRDQPETGLTEAITCLFKAEKMNDFDKYVHLAEEAIRSVSPDKYEKCPFQIDIHKDEVHTEKTYKPIEVISYIGTTKPADQ